MDTTEKIAGRVVGNTSTAESSVGFKADIQNMIERYAMENVDIARDFERILARENTRNDFIDRVTESVNTTEALSDSAMVSDSFYSNYTERLAQLIAQAVHLLHRNQSLLTGNFLRTSNIPSGARLYLSNPIAGLQQALCGSRIQPNKIVVQRRNL